MKIAVTYEDGRIFQHFGHTEQFKIYETADGRIVRAEVVDTNGSGHGALAALAEADIRLYGGTSGEADAAVNALLSGNLGYDPDVHCSHHDHEHGEGGHTCGSHGCGGHSCH